MNNLKKSETWVVQLRIGNNFISSIDHDEEFVMHSESGNIETMINDETDELFDSLKNRYQNNLELINGSQFIFDYVHLLYYKCHKINLNGGGSHIGCPDWIKKAKINPINKNKCFQYIIKATLNHEEKEDILKKFKKLNLL